MMQQTYCVMPWVGLEINNDGGMKPCCVYADSLLDSDGKKFNINTHTIDEYLESDAIRVLKDDLLNNKELSGCNKCYREENVNVQSLRLRKNNRFEEFTKIENNLEENNLLTVDLKLSNLCNQKCMICNTNASSMIVAENNVILPDLNLNYVSNKYHWYKNEDVWDQLMKKTLNSKHFDFYGGEPWLIKQQWKFLEYLISSGRSSEITLNYATNGSLHEDFYFTEYFSKFKHVSILYSADGIEDTFEYVRYPGVWETYKENIIKAKEFQKSNILDCWVAVAYTVSVYSIHNVIPSLNFYKDHNIPVWFNLVNEDEFSPSILPAPLRKKILDNIKENWSDDFLLVDSDINADYFEKEVTKDISDSWKHEWARRTNKRDQHRNIRFTDILDDNDLKEFMNARAQK